MRIAVIADIHGNLYAMQALIHEIDSWKPDRVIVLGDVVNRGPRPKECLEIILERAEKDGWLLVRGNHEDYVIDLACSNGDVSPFYNEVHQATKWTLEKLDFDVSSLISMPPSQELNDPAGNLTIFTHASQRGNRDGIYPETTDDELREQIDGNASLFCVGHTHRPLIRKIDNTKVINVGSAGLPFDGDTHPSYGRVEWLDNQWIAEISRFEYDIDAARRDFFNSGYWSEAGPLVRLVLIELEQARSMLYYWATRYQKLAIEGKISMAASVDAILHELAH